MPLLKVVGCLGLNETLGQTDVLTLGISTQNTYLITFNGATSPPVATYIVTCKKCTCEDCLHSSSKGSGSAACLELTPRGFILAAQRVLPDAVSKWVVCPRAQDVNHLPSHQRTRGLGPPTGSCSAQD